MRKILHVASAVLAFNVLVWAQTFYSQVNSRSVILTGTSAPGSCLVGDVFINSTSGAMSTCTAVNTWSSVGGSSSGLPSGAIILIDSGSCPAGTTEVSAMNGVTALGTLVANGNVGGTGGADTITPAGTNGAQTIAWPAGVPTNASESAHTHAVGTLAAAWPAGVPTHSGTAATFSGNALGTHAHEIPFQLSSTTATRQIAAATFGTGTSRAATGASAAGSSNTTSAAVALSQAVSAGTPAGSVTITNQGTIAWPAGVPALSGSTAAGSSHTHTVSWPAGVPTVGVPSFTGTQFDNRSAFRRVIYCKAN